ncbi:uncharacterized protein LOC128285532 [Gossypium arboreum]|uniref:uncharacterized protein LOC128285532 n=1 Tax=Gossypium arboreum TaxID=29729 RepID=UPI0022F14935|nr:uncharacterized protein LOC128285532 [Gossypium arboreum]
MKKSKEEFSQATSVPERSGKSRPRQFDYKASDRPAVSVEEEVEQREKQKILPQKERRSGQSSATGATRSGMKDTTSQSEVRAPARTYAIRAREEATVPDVIAGNEAYLAYILDTRSSKSKLEQLSVVNEFMDVFPEELLGLPPDREVEFVIDVLPGTAPISVTPYRMAPAELRELKAQLQELLDKGFIRPRWFIEAVHRLQAIE